MRAAVSSLFVAVTSVAAMALTGSAAVAAEDGTATQVVPYEQCTDLDTGGYTCASGRTVVRTTITPSGAANGTLIDTGRYEFADGTGCITTGIFQIRTNFAATPAQAGHVVQRTTNRVLGTTRCGDRSLDTRCHVRSTVDIQVFRDRSWARIETRVDCDPPS